MEQLPTNTVQVLPENKCDVCKENLAIYYNNTYYIHICSISCYEKFIEMYNKEIDDVTIERLTPDKNESRKDK